MTLLFFCSIVSASAASFGTAAAHLGNANQFLEQERFQEAADEYQKALEINPDLLNARRDLAVCRFELRQYQQAKELLSDLLHDPSTNSQAHYYLGRIDLLEGKFTPAIAQFLSIPSAHPFRDEHYFLGMAYFKSSAWGKCVDILRVSIQENPRDFRSHQLLARALQKLGRTDQAKTQFAKTRKLLSYYAEGSQALRRCAQIKETCQTLIETDDVDKLAALGMVLGNAGSFDQAETVWKRAALLDPDSPEIRYNLALTCFHLKNRVCARDNAKAAIDARPEFPEANVLYATVLYMLGADTQALPALRRARALNPRDNNVRELLSNELKLWADHYAKAGNTTEARNLLSELDRLQTSEGTQP